MASNRIGRINEEIQRELSELLRNLKDPRVHKTMLSITRVETTPDLRYAKVYVSLLDKEATKETLAGLKSSAGFLRRELGKNLHLRYTPELQWQIDDSITHGAHILDILSKLDIPEDSDDETADNT
ncbi:MAG: 30S ribosome-binding factor RbfA [Oscillospiraceae bacterium]|nr:30S ribosome-binding factor RbfA [Oscillospiraceae bacterium]